MHRKLNKKKKILHLTLTKKWFALIATGKKPIEYRQIKPHWAKRFLDDKGFLIQDFTEVHFKNGYRPKAPFCRVEFKKISIVGIHDNHVPKNGEELEGRQFAIHLGEVLEVKNFNG